jgi:hypothetical protein
MLTDRDELDVNKADRYGRAAIHRAALYGIAELIDMCVGKGKNSPSRCY